MKISNINFDLKIKEIFLKKMRKEIMKKKVIKVMIVQEIENNQKNKLFLY